MSHQPAQPLLLSPLRATAGSSHFSSGVGFDFYIFSHIKLPGTLSRREFKRGTPLDTISGFGHLALTHSKTKITLSEVFCPPPALWSPSLSKEPPLISTNVDSLLLQGRIRIRHSVCATLYKSFVLFLPFSSSFGLPSAA